MRRRLWFWAKWTGLAACLVLVGATVVAVWLGPGGIETPVGFVPLDLRMDRPPRADLLAVGTDDVPLATRPAGTALPAAARPRNHG